MNTDTTETPDTSPDSGGGAWEINDDPEPRWDEVEKSRESRKDDPNGEAWEINENTVAQD